MRRRSVRDVTNDASDGFPGAELVGSPANDPAIVHGAASVSSGAVDRTKPAPMWGV